MDQEWKDYVQDRLKAAKTVDEMDEIITHEIQKLWPKYKRRKLYFQAKQEKLDKIKFIAEIKSKVRFTVSLFLISTDKKCQHCHTKGPLKFEDLHSFLAYIVVMGLKNPDLIEYLFEKINVETQEITIKNSKTGS